VDDEHFITSKNRHSNNYLLKLIIDISFYIRAQQVKDCDARCKKLYAVAQDKINRQFIVSQDAMNNKLCPRTQEIIHCVPGCRK
jgi:hypothetical protein